jgi:hypothetical protein
MLPKLVVERILHYFGWLCRAEVLRQREKYEAGNMGGYTRIFPSKDPKLQVKCEKFNTWIWVVLYPN